MLCTTESWLTRCIDRLLASLGHKSIFSDDKYSFQTNLEPVNVYLSMFIRYTNPFTNAHFVWFLITIKTSRLIDWVAPMDLLLIASKSHVLTIAYYLLLQCSILTLHRFLTTIPCHIRAIIQLCLGMKPPSGVQGRNQLTLNWFRMRLASHTQTSSRLIMLHP